MSTVEETQPAYLAPAVGQAIEARGRPFVPIEGLESALRRSWERVRRTHPDIKVSWGPFASWLASRLEGDDHVRALARVCIEDLYLCCAVLQGDRAAGEAFDRLLEEAEASLCREFRPAEVRRVLLRLTRILLVGEASRPGLVRYQGRGRLRAWVVAEARRALSPHPLVGEDDEVTQTAVVRDPAKLTPERNELLQRAFVAAIGKISARDRLLLQRYYLDGADPADLGSGSATDSIREVAAAKRALIAETKRQLRATSSVDTVEIDRFIGLLRGGLGVAIGRRMVAKALRKESGAATTGDDGVRSAR